METADVQARLRRPRLLRDAVRESGRRPARLTTHAVMVFGPLGVVMSVTGALLAGDSGAALVNGWVVLLGELSTPLLGWSAVASVVSAAALVIVLSATVIAAAGLGVARLSGRLWPAIVVTAVPVLVVLPALLVVPAVVLERRTAWNALHRARLLLSENRWRGAFTLTVGAAVVPAAAALSLYGLVDLVPTSLASVVIGIGGAVLAVGVPALQAVVSARTFLFLLAYHHGEPAFEEVARTLPDVPAHRSRTTPVVVALLLPGLRHWGGVQADPLGWPRTEESDVAPGLTSDTGRPLFSRADLRDLRAWQGPNGLVVVGDRMSGTSLLACDGDPCRAISSAWGLPNREWGPTASARLADGRLVMTGWARDRRRWPGRLPAGAADLQPGELRSRAGAGAVPRDQRVAVGHLRRAGRTPGRRPGARAGARTYDGGGPRVGLHHLVRRSGLRPSRGHEAAAAARPLRGHGARTRGGGRPRRTAGRGADRRPVRQRLRALVRRSGLPAGARDDARERPRRGA
ncbi:hypothetical protein ACIBP6_35880 [Nonomuraea terrae]|uniref:hypothetical protein n=1 Tax=Nonomuraea terrae TaxID=2530383 RepID=UPI0037958040